MNTNRYILNFLVLWSVMVIVASSKHKEKGLHLERHLTQNLYPKNRPMVKYKEHGWLGAW